jgi:hypothetical protein
LVIPPLARLIEYIIIENSVLRNPCRIWGNSKWQNYWDSRWH